MADAKPRHPTRWWHAVFVDKETMDGLVFKKLLDTPVRNRGETAEPTES